MALPPGRRRLRWTLQAQGWALALRRAATRPAALLTLLGTHRLARGPLWPAIGGALWFSGAPAHGLGPVNTNEAHRRSARSR
jgi:hypothetical protein